MFRLLLPSIVTFAITALALIILTVFLIRNTEDNEAKRIIKKIAIWLIGLGFAGWCSYVINIASVNSIPRNDPDRKAQEEGINNFQEKMQHDAAQPKVK